MSSAKQTTVLTIDQSLLWEASDKSEKYLTTILKITSGNLGQQIAKITAEMKEEHPTKFKDAGLLCLFNLLMAGPESR